MLEAITNIQIDAYDYYLPENRIALYPLAQRNASKLLIHKHDNLTEDVFAQLGKYLPEKSLLVLNETKVIQARLNFSNKNGASIEVFVLKPSDEACDYQLAFAKSSPAVWDCLIGNSKRWKSDLLQLDSIISNEPVSLYAERLEKKQGFSVIRFTWSKQELSFAEILENMGEVPLPPYLNRQPEEDDKLRYQAVFARYEGSVAAPTASLHLTEIMIQDLISKGHSFAYLTLHVGAGTFKPVSTNSIGDHEMHIEQIVVSRQLVQALLLSSVESVIAVGTTSMRTVESLFWLGLMLYDQGLENRPLHVPQWFPYQTHQTIPDKHIILNSLLQYMNQHYLDSIKASTALMIVPGYRFRIAQGLITNFHQPKSTLLLLVAALIGPKWKEAYRYALDNDFRFLSYGDGCLFLNQDQ